MTDLDAEKTPIILKPTLTFVIPVVLLAIMVGGFYFFWKQLQIRDQRLAEFQQQVESAERMQDKFLQKSAEEQLAMQSMAQDQLARFEEKLEKLNSTDHSDWLLAETEYLLRLANQYATLAHDAAAAEALLANADSVLHELEKKSTFNKSIVGIRKKIAEERAVLKLRAELDREGLYLKLEAFIKQVDQIPVIDIANISKKDQTVENLLIAQSDSVSQRMSHSFFRAMEKIGGYIRVRRHDHDIGPLLSPDQQQHLKQNLLFRIEQAQIALLQRHQDVYINSLSNAKEWIKKYYVIDPVLKNKMLEELDEYSRYDVEEPLPDIGGSLSALKIYMQTRRPSGGK